MEQELPQFFVGFIQLHLAVAHFQRLAMPFIQLLSEPNGMLFRGQHVQHIG